MIFFQVFLPLIFLLVGLALGSFSNVVIYRESNQIPLNSRKRSFCPNCGHELKWYDNIPLISYLILKGKCRYCQKPISKRYPLVELTGAFIFLSVYFVYAYIYDGTMFVFHYLDSPQAIIDSVIFSLLLLFLFDGSFIDYKTRTIPLYISIGVALMGIIRYVLTAILTKSYLPLNLISVGVSLVFFLSTYFLGMLIYKREVMGLGDIIVLVGLAFGFDILRYGLFFILISVLASVIELIRQKSKGPREIPFIPYIFNGVVFLVFLVEPLAGVLLNFLGF
ncbi:MAG: prepilin peptidase [Bacilli bacterium]|jgi:leader peptidase (prepilin peptidase)/N-methyltransferase|nr:prepilin peptidase [Bacilli bacterium]